MGGTRRRNLLSLASLAAAVLGVCLSSLPSQAAGYWRKGTFVMGGGFNFPVGETEKYLNSSGSMMIGGGRHINKSTTLEVEWTHNWLGIDPAVIDRAASDSVQFDNAYASNWSVTLNLIRRLHPDKDIVPWVTGGVGYYKRNLQITQTVLLYYPPIWDPWWGWIDGGWAPGEAITGSREAYGLGWNVGVGVDFEIESGASLFLDARYHRTVMDGVDVTIVPVMAGIRW
jgi:opacity protein-like surface antigen